MSIVVILIYVSFWPKYEVFKKIEDSFLYASARNDIALALLQKSAKVSNSTCLHIKNIFAKKAWRQRILCILATYLLFVDM